MTRLRLLPIVLFAVSALLCLKLMGLVAGLGSFAIGPHVAVAQEADGSPPSPPPMPDFVGAPLDLAAEAEALRLQQEAEAEAAGGSSDVVAGEAAPPDAGSNVDGGTVAASETEPPPDAVPQEAAGAAPEAGPTQEPATAAPEAAAVPPGELPPGLTTVRPAEFTPPARGSQQDFVESLSARRQELDRRAADLELKVKLLEAAEANLEARIAELRAIEEQLGVRPASAPTNAQETRGDPVATPAPAPEAAAPPDDQELAKLVTMYEAMKPKAAARVFNDLNIHVLLAVSRAMNPRRMSAILAVMDPGKAAVLTTALAGNQQPREIIVRRDAGYIAPSPDSLPKIMPAAP